MNPNEYWLGELVSYLLEQARYEREAVTMDAIDREKLEEHFGCPSGDIDIEKIALSEWEQVKQWNNYPSPHYSRLAPDLSEASGIGRVDGGFRGGFSLRVGD